MASRTPDVMDAVALLIDTLWRVPRPMAIPRGVIMEYTMAPKSGAQVHDGGSCKNASRVPSPRPSNISAMSVASSGRGFKTHGGR